MIALNNQMKPERGAPLHLVDFQLGVLQTSKMEISQHTIVAKSQAMQRVLELARRVARSEATVLISGESGTGKERLAQFVHAQSQRSSGPFVAINCGALPEALLESELFGHVKGAFTGAIADTQGLFSAAAGGTLFLDEIGETSLAVQVRLLRALQERTVRPVGATRDRRVDVRVITATNRDLPHDGRRGHVPHRLVLSTAGGCAGPAAAARSPGGPAAFGPAFHWPNLRREPLRSVRIVGRSVG